jgi:hypothetical protein
MVNFGEFQHLFYIGDDNMYASTYEKLGWVHLWYQWITHNKKDNAKFGYRLISNDDPIDCVLKLLKGDKYITIANSALDQENTVFLLFHVPEEGLSVVDKRIYRNYDNRDCGLIGNEYKVIAVKIPWYKPLPHFESNSPNFIGSVDSYEMSYVQSTYKWVKSWFV